MAVCPRQLLWRHRCLLRLHSPCSQRPGSFRVTFPQTFTPPRHPGLCRLSSLHRHRVSWPSLLSLLPQSPPLKPLFLRKTMNRDHRVLFLPQQLRFGTLAAATKYRTTCLTSTQRTHMKELTSSPRILHSCLRKHSLNSTFE